MTKLSDFLSLHDLSSDEKDQNDECMLECAAEKENPSKLKGLDVLRKTSFDISTFTNLCGEASALLLLLRLSNFLREAYSGVTTTRLLEYLPGEKERVADRGVTRVSNIQPFNSYIPHESHTSGIGRSATTSILDNSIRQYAEFRRLMRENDEKMSVLISEDSGSSTVEVPSQQHGNKRKRSGSGLDD